MARLIDKLSDEPIALYEAKLQCYIDPSDNDPEVVLNLTRWISAARTMAEGRTWLGLLHGRYEHQLHSFPDGDIELPKSPIHEIESIKYIDGGVEQTLSPDGYYEDTYSVPGIISPVTSWPAMKKRPGGVTITYQAGYLPKPAGQDITKVIPEDIKGAILILIKYLYDNRDGTSEKGTPSALPKTALDILEDASARAVV